MFPLCLEPCSGSSSLRVKATALRAYLFLTSFYWTPPSPTLFQPLHTINVPGTSQDSLTLGLSSEILSAQISFAYPLTSFRSLLKCFWFVKPCSDPLYKLATFYLWFLRPVLWRQLLPFTCFIFLPRIYHHVIYIQLLIVCIFCPPRMHISMRAEKGSVVQYCIPST